MEIPVLIEPVPGNGYVAKTGEPLALSAEGPSVPRRSGISKIKCLGAWPMDRQSYLQKSKTPRIPGWPWLECTIPMIQRCRHGNRRWLNTGQDRRTSRAAMSLYVLDTDMLTLLEKEHPAVLTRVRAPIRETWPLPC